MAPKASSRPLRRAPGFSTAYMDRRADPRKDFYRFANGKWLKTHPLPPDKARHGSFGELADWNLACLRRIAERCAQEGSIAKGGTESLVGKFYRSALDARAREKAGFGPIEELWKTAGDVSSGEDVARALPGFHRMGVNALFQSFTKPDDRNSEVYAFFMWQGGLSLPDRDYYVSKNFAGTRKEYLAHMERMFQLRGFDRRKASRWSGSVLKVETAIAKASRTRTDLRDPVRNYNRTEAEDLESKYGHLLPREYLRALGAGSPGYVVVGQPEFLSAVSSLVSRQDPDDWRAYLCWSVLTGAAPYLHKEVDEENFEFFHKKLIGQKKQEPAWKRAIRVIDGMVGEALGELYVAEYFPEAARRRAAELVENLSAVLVRRLKALPWMAEATRAEALEKFSKFRVKIGHPDRFRDYSSIRIDPEDYAGNVMRAAAFESDRQSKRVGGPVDKDEWYMTPPTVNAYFAPETNEIVFPAGILQPPFFDFKADDALNYGGIGAVIGHEITHGYDDQGRQYDAKGNLRDWWTKEDERAFKERAGGVVKVYGEQEIIPGVMLNGKLTLGENIADLGGASISYEALMGQLGKEGSKRKIDGLTPQQRFFVSWGQIWKEVVSEQESRRRATIDPHSPGKVRGVIPVVNHPAFDEAFPPKKRSLEGTRRGRIGVW